jgi:hypothetical protein
MKFNRLRPFVTVSKSQKLNLFGWPIQAVGSKYRESNEVTMMGLQFLGLRIVRAIQLNSVGYSGFNAPLPMGASGVTRK